MIRLTKKDLPFNSERVESIKINNLYASYPDTALFWVQSESNTVISMLDTAVFVDFSGGDTEEIREFLSVIGATSIFSSMHFFESLGITPQKTVSVMKYADRQSEESAFGDELKSDEIYSLLNVEGLELPVRDIFSVDYCHRKNHGLLDSFAIRDKAAAISLNFDDSCVITGISSREKGFGSIVLKGIISKNKNRKVFACCNKSIENFYIKNGFVRVYEAGYRVEKL